MCKRFLAVITVFVLTVITAPFTAYCSNNYAPDDVKTVVEGVLSYKSDELGAEDTAELLQRLSDHAGDFSADWYYIAMSQFGIVCRDKDSISALKAAVDGFYSSGLPNVKVTDLQRVAFALSACGEDITNVNGHNLLADATYDRGKLRPLDSQGANSASYALLLLDSKNYDVPAGAYNTREDIIEMIVSKELESGGFSLFGSAADVDLTTIALQALAPYADHGNVKDVVDRGVAILSKRQNSTGAYKSFSNEISCETTAQVILALTALSINPMTDSRFVRDGNSALDGLMLFRLDSGAFSHFKDGKADNMASYQALCAVVSVYRYLNGEKSFYDFTEKPQPIEVEITTVAESEKKPAKTPTKANNNSDTENKASFKISVSSDETAPEVHYSEEVTEKPTEKKRKKANKKKPTDASSKASTEATVTQSAPSSQSVTVRANNSNTENKRSPFYIDCVVLLIIYISIFEYKRRSK